jgi:hypothetical protein
MARIIGYPLHFTLNDTTGNAYIIRVRNGKAFLVKKPDMSNVQRTKKQLEQQSKFAKAVKYAQEIIRDPRKKAAYKVKKGESVYNKAVKEYMKRKK